MTPAQLKMGNSVFENPARISLCRRVCAGFKQARDVGRFIKINPSLLFTRLRIEGRGTRLLCDVKT